MQNCLVFLKPHGQWGGLPAQQLAHLWALRPPEPIWGGGCSAERPHAWCGKGCKPCCVTSLHLWQYRLSPGLLLTPLMRFLQVQVQW